MLNGLESTLIKSPDFFTDDLVILGSSRSVKNFKTFGGPAYTIAVGDLPIRAPKLGPFDLWVTCNTEFPQPFKRHHLSLMLNSNCKQIALSTIAWNDSKEEVRLEALLQLQSHHKPIFMFFDQRHFAGNRCDPIRNCCVIFEHLKQKITIQELIQQTFLGREKSYGFGHTVAIHALAIGILKNPKRIYLYGIDLPSESLNYRHYKQYAKIGRTIPGNIQYLYNFFRSQKHLPHSSAFGGDLREELLDDFQILIDLANKLEIKVFVNGASSSLLKLSGVLRH